MSVELGEIETESVYVIPVEKLVSVLLEIFILYTPTLSQSRNAKYVSSLESAMSDIQSLITTYAQFKVPFISQLLTVVSVLLSAPIYIVEETELTAIESTVVNVYPCIVKVCPGAVVF